jgi:hypothetical protein
VGWEPGSRGFEGHFTKNVFGPRASREGSPSRPGRARVCYTAPCSSNIITTLFNIWLQGWQMTQPARLQQAQWVPVTGGTTEMATWLPSSGPTS